ncbi:hypothetical protein [Nocardia fluminea]|uniref:DUF8176 domain-containing protein n=1 Tax=Nocardia fluminea TaxID=134984 RepID=A0A2N3VIX3_9NOCA|nr:hypothetical protein [Nocardia fluminea]PKV81554.1 hypothetical protein ATK86_6022 [Nocardia fluminea]
MDRPEAHRPIGARQHDPGSAGAPLAAVTPIRRSRDLSAPRPRRVGDQPTGGARHRIEGGPTTPAGIPVISAARLRDAEHDEVVPVVPGDATVTDRLPVVGGKFDPGARHRLPDTASSIDDNGPDTDQLPIVTSTGPAWAALDHPRPGYDTAATRHSRPTPEYPGADTFPPRPAAVPTSGADTFPRRLAPENRPDTFPPRPAPVNRADTFPPRPALENRADTFPPRPALENRADTFPPLPVPDNRADIFPPRAAPEYRGPEAFPPHPAPDRLGTDTFLPRLAPGYPETNAPSSDDAAHGADDESSRTAPDYSGDDEVFARMIDRSKRRRVPRWVAPLVASVAGAVLLGGTYVQLRGPAPASTAASTPLIPSSVSPVTAACPTEQIGAMVRGNGAGGTESGIAAIMAFQHAYYVARSGDEARTLVAPGAVAPSAAAIQAGIDSTPVGTTHCVEITPGAYAGQYLVKITAFRPDSAPSTYTPQLVGTAEVGNKTLITSFGAAPR